MYSVLWRGAEVALAAEDAAGRGRGRVPDAPDAADAAGAADASDAGAGARALPRRLAHAAARARAQAARARARRRRHGRLGGTRAFRQDLQTAPHQTR